MQLTIRKIGNSFGVLLPKEVINDLNVKVGDVLNAVRSENGVLWTAMILISNKLWKRINNFHSNTATDCRNWLNEGACLVKNT